MMRYRRILGSALVGIAIIATLPAGADPAQDQLSLYRELSTQAEKLNEDYLAAKEDLNIKQQELNRLNVDLQMAIQNQAATQAEADALINQAFIGGEPISSLSSLLSSQSQEDLLQKYSYLGIVADNKRDALQQLEQAKTHVSDLQRVAQKATDDAQRLVSDIESRKRDLDQRIQSIELTRARLSPAQNAELRNIGTNDVPNVVAPGPKAQIAVDAALSKLGSIYVWGATGPSTFDCSGLTQWAYKQAGISIPRVSRDQAKFGQLVSASSLQPGDLVFFGSPIHHVGMYIGEGKMVHAPTTGDVVKISNLQSPLVVARRVA